jgi:hypothetical protein
MKFVIWGFFDKSVEKIQVSLKSDKTSGTLHGDQYTFLAYLILFFLEWEMFQTRIVEKIETHFISDNFIFPKVVLFMR